MALPSAQLGGLPSLSVPSHVPVVQTQKEPKLWEKALLSMLTQIGTAAIGEGVGNVMERDFAPEFGEDKAKGMDKLLRGASVDERQAGQRREINAADRRQRIGIMADATRDRFNATEATRRQTAGIEADITKEELDQQRFMAGLQDRGQDRTARNRVVDKQMHGAFLLEQIKALRAQQLQEAVLAAQQPESAARTAKLQEETEGQRLGNRYQAQGLPPSSTSAPISDELTPRQQAVQAAAERRRLQDERAEHMANRRRYSPTPEETLADNLAKRAAANGVTPEQVTSRLQEQTAQPEVDPNEELRMLMASRGNRTPVGTLPGDRRILELIRELRLRPKAAEPMFPNAVWNTPWGHSSNSSPATNITQ